MIPLSNRNIYQAFALAVVITFCLLCLIVPLLNPVDNWDMLGYAASIKSLYGLDVAAIHTSVFSEYKSYATAQHFELLTADSSYRRTMYMDAEAFYQQIPFYKIRVLYVLLLTAASQAGVNVFTAMHFFSPFFGAAAFLTLYLGMRHHVHPFVWIAVPPFYFFLTLEFSLFQHGGVDSFAFFWVAMTTVAFFRGSKWLYPLLALSVLVRTDLILHAALMFAVALYFNRTDWRQIIVWGVITLIAYFSVNSWAGNFGWTALINFVFVSDMLATHPEQYAQNKLGVKQYLGFVLGKQDWISPWFWLSIAISMLNLLILLAIFFLPRIQQYFDEDQIRSARRLQIISAVCLIYIILHYVLFPAVFMRFFYGQCFLSILALLTTMSLAAGREEIRQLRDSTKRTVNSGNA